MPWSDRSNSRRGSWLRCRGRRTLKVLPRPSSLCKVTSPPNSFEKVKAAVEQLGVTIDNAEITMQPKQTVAVDEDKAAAVLRLMESLEEDDDVQQVYANFDIPSNVLERVSAQV